MPSKPHENVQFDTANGPRGLVLASSSPYRRELLERFGLPFSWRAPGVDERPLPGESAGQLVNRLAEQKVRATAAEFPRHLIIGGDQVAVRDGAIIGKPHTREAAVAQLEAASGRELTFMTSVGVLDSVSSRIHTEVVACRVQFRRLSRRRIENYVATESPLDCAGSFKCEGLGIVLFERIDMTDPTVLTGLPLITLVTLLERHGLDILTVSAQR